MLPRWTIATSKSSGSPPEGEFSPSASSTPASSARTESVDPSASNAPRSSSGSGMRRSMTRRPNSTKRPGSASTSTDQPCGFKAAHISPPKRVAVDAMIESPMTRTRFPSTRSAIGPVESSATTAARSTSGSTTVVVVVAGAVVGTPSGSRPTPATVGTGVGAVSTSVSPPPIPHAATVSPRAGTSATTGWRRDIGPIEARRPARPVSERHDPAQPVAMLPADRSGADRSPGGGRRGRGGGGGGVRDAQRLPARSWSRISVRSSTSVGPVSSSITSLRIRPL